MSTSEPLHLTAVTRLRPDTRPIPRRAPRPRWKATLRTLLLTAALLLVLSGFAASASPLDAWRDGATRILQLATANNLAAEQNEEGHSIILALPTQRLFTDRRDTFAAEVRPFLDALGAEFAALPGIRINLTAYAKHPAAGFNPVLLGWRLRALQVFLAERGVPIRQIHPLVKDEAELDRSSETTAKRCCGKLIVLELKPRQPPAPQ